MDLVSNTISLGSSTIALGSSTIVSWVFAIWGSAYTTSLRLGLHLGGEYMYASEERAGPGSQIKHSSEWLVHSKEFQVSLASYWLHTPAFGCLHTWYWWPMLLAEIPTPSTESPNYWSDKDLFSHLRFSLELSKFSLSMNFPERDLVSVAGGMICFRVIFRFASFPKFPSTHYCQESTPRASSAAACPP